MGFENQNIEQINSLNDDITLRELILKIIKWYKYLKSKQTTIFIGCLIGGIIGLLVAFYDKPIYKAVLTFAMDEDKNSGGGLSGALGLASNLGIDLGSANGGGAFASSNLSELMKSRLIVEKVLLEPVIINEKKTSLAEYYIEINKLRKEWLSKPYLQNIRFLPNADRSKFSIQQDSILQLIHRKLIDKENLTIIQKDKKVTILTIEVKSEDEVFSKTFCENLAKETSDFYVETRSKKAKINVDVLQKQVDSVRAELNNAITGVAEATDNVYNLNPAYNIKVTPSKKKQIDVQANTAIITNLVIQLELAKITLRKETPLIQLIDKPILPLEKLKLGKLKTLIFCALFSGILTIIYLIIKKKYNNMFA